MPKIIPPTFITQSEEALDKGYDPNVARGLLQFVKPYTWQMLIALFFMILVTIASVLGPYFVRLAIDYGITANDPATLEEDHTDFLCRISRAIGGQLSARADHVSCGAACVV